VTHSDDIGTGVDSVTVPLGPRIVFVVVCGAHEAASDGDPRNIPMMAIAQMCFIDFSRWKPCRLGQRGKRAFCSVSARWASTYCLTLSSGAPPALAAK